MCFHERHEPAQESGHHPLVAPTSRAHAELPVHDLMLMAVLGELEELFVRDDAGGGHGVESRALGHIVPLPRERRPAGGDYGQGLTRLVRQGPPMRKTGGPEGPPEGSRLLTPDPYRSWVRTAPSSRTAASRPCSRACRPWPLPGPRPRSSWPRGCPSGRWTACRRCRPHRPACPCCR